MRFQTQKTSVPGAIVLSALLALAAGCTGKSRPAASAPQNTGRLTAGLISPALLSVQPMTVSLRDGTPGKMWGYCETAAASCTPGATWAPGPILTATPGSPLLITLTNNLNVPTSLVILGQLGGGVGSPTTMIWPQHPALNVTTFPSNADVGPAGPSFVPPAQGPRVSSFGTEIGPHQTGTLTFPALRPGTYIYETGTWPALQVPMGLYGILVVTNAPTKGASPQAGSAYPGVSYDDEVALLFSEMDPVQNAAVDAAAAAGAQITKRFNDPSCTAATPCYPAGVNYTPTYFFINGVSYDRTNPQGSAFLLGDATAYQSGNLLVRMLNAGSRTHVPAVTGTTMSLIAEDGNPLPGKPRGQTEVLLTASKTMDVLIRPAAATGGASYASATFGVFDRALNLSTANYPNGGMQGFLLVNHAAAATQSVTVNGVTSVVSTPGAPGNLPAAVAAQANPDTVAVAFNSPRSFDVTANDVGVTKVALISGSGPSHGALTPLGDGRFRYVPTTGYSGADSFQYFGNGDAANAALTATVTLNVGTQGGPPHASNDSFSSAIAGKFSTGRPGVLANDTDDRGLQLTAGGAVYGTCGTVTLAADGSFSVTTSTPADPSCQFTYTASNSLGATSTPATVTVTFGAASGLTVAVVDAKDGTAIPDYRWTIQEDLTFKADTRGTPSVSTRTLGTSFHRSHNNVVATGCVGAVSCGAGQTALDDATGRHTLTDEEALAKQTLPSQVSLDPTKRYYISILPGDAGNPAGGCDPGAYSFCDPEGGGHQMGGAELKPSASGAWAATIRLQKTPIEPAQLSIYIYEDNLPTNGQDDLNEQGLGGFNIILSDPAGRTGDIAGQQTFDASNMPLSNALLGTPGCPDELNTRTNGGAFGDNHTVGAIYTCPNAPAGYTGDPARYALAGHALIKNLTPARYDVVARPAAAREEAGEIWWQTETLEGTAAQDAFVGINEPVYFQEFGPPGFHTTIGFVNPTHVAETGRQFPGAGSVRGKVTNQHMSRPSNVTLYDSTSYDLLFSTTCQVVLNITGGAGQAIAAAQCDPEGNFVLTGIPAGTYDLAVFDQWLDQIIQTNSVTIPDSGNPNVDMGNIPVLSWFTQQDLNIYQDLNKNGVYDDGEPGISNVLLSVRYRNGAPSNQTLSDSAGNGILVELFPLFNWYVTEADTTRFKQTGVHIWVDGGGKTDTDGVGSNIWSSIYPTGESAERIDKPGALAYGIQSFISQRNRVDWGRTSYAKGENGGIQGLVVYSSTRPFDDQRLNVQTIWEPLVPRVTMNLYMETANEDGTTSLALVDSAKTSSWDDWVNLVYGADGNSYMLGPDNKLRNPDTGALAAQSAYPPGRQVNMQCPGQLPGTTSPGPWDTTAVDPFTSFTLGNDRFRCYDGFHNWNQVQPAPYDGRYNFPSQAYIAAHPLTDAEKTAGKTLVSLPPGVYVVEAVTPPGYEIVKEEDKNILIGDAFNGPAVQQFGPLGSIFILPDQATLNNANPNNPVTADGTQSDPTTNLGIYVTSTGTQFPECAGKLHRVPDFLSLFPQAQQVAPFAGMDRPLCDRKRVLLNDQMQSSANFFVFTETPVAANSTGMILDDATTEFNPVAPDFGEKGSVPFVPVSIKDWSGTEISRTYSDQWGTYNMLTPSSWLVNPPTPSGYGPNMLVTCMNDPGPIPDPATGKMVPDPAYNPAYSNFCYTMPFMPGQTTYLDTPVLPIAAFAAGYNPPDCAQPEGSPVIRRVDSSSGFGPWLPQSGGRLTIQAEGDQSVLNPGYSGPFATTGPSSQRNVTRHYGFGNAQGHVTLNGTDLQIITWGDGSITVNVPSNLSGLTAVPHRSGERYGQLVVTTAAGRSSVDGVTVTLGGSPVRVTSSQSIQAALDAASPGTLILLDAGVYNELVIMWKPVRLQGVGASSVIINAAKYPTSKLAAWRPRINDLFAVDPTTGNSTGTSQIDPLPTQEITGGVVLLEPTVLGAEEGAGITVLAKNLPGNGNSQCNLNGGPTSTIGRRVRESNFNCQPSLIDGISITGGDAGGGIYVNGWAHGLEIANNRIYGNAGAYHGGLRIGVPYLELDTLPTTGANVDGFGYDVGVKIHHNSITKNGTVEAPAGNGGAGGGVAICTGTDNYSIDHNFICGNYSANDGGGIGHLGFSQGGVIAFNQILFNQSFQQTNATHGGGITVAGEPPIGGTVSLGSGSLTIDANVIRGNFAEGGHGGGIRVQQANGQDVSLNPNTPARWHQITVSNNVIDNNVAGWSGGGISLADTLNVQVINNTIAVNDSAGIAGPDLVRGVGQPSAAGLAVELTTAPLLAEISNGQRNRYRIPLSSQLQSGSVLPLTNNILWHNRSFFYSGDGRLCAGNNRNNPACVVLADQASSGDCTGSDSGARYWDLGVLGDANGTSIGSQGFAPRYSVLSQGSPYGTGTNTATGTSPVVARYCNGSRVVPEYGSVINPPSPLNLQAAATVDEGNNFVNMRYGPLYSQNPSSGAIVGNYHLPAARAGQSNALPSALRHDVDGQSRPNGARWDIGADQFATGQQVPAILALSQGTGAQ